MNSYFKQLDALRFISVSMVILVHLPLIELSDTNIFKIFSSYVSGVSLFFCISGFLITGILITHHENKKTQVLKSFYLRRFLRIFPVYYLTVLLLYIININNYRDWAINDILYLSNIVQGLNGEFGGTVAPHFWSLAVEEQFYLLWPAVFLFVKKKWSLLLAFSLFAIGLISTFISQNSFLMARTLTCLAFLGSGAILAVLHSRDKNFMRSRRIIPDFLILTTLVIIAFVSLDLLKVNWQVKFVIGTIVIPALVWRFAIGYSNLVMKRIFENPIIIYLGKISYGLYIYHLLMLYPAVAIKKVFSLSFLEDPFTMQIFKIVLAIVISALSWELFEKQINKFKSKFPYTKTPDKTGFGST